MGYIYSIKNSKDGKIYIGQTIQDLEERWRQHRSKNSNCRYLRLAINKYGINNFVFKLICICFDDDLDKYELYYIKKYNSIVPNGYNLREGGNSGKHNNETKMKISEGLKNRKDIVRSNHQLGKPHSEAVKIKISNSLKGIKHSQESIKKRSDLLIKHTIFQIDMNGTIVQTFNGYTEAAKSVGTHKGAIWRVCQGKGKTIKGYIWKSVEK
jgi:group I intron endonuclease